MGIKVLNEWEVSEKTTCIIVANYFLKFQDNTIRHYPFYFLENASRSVFDIGVWKIKQLKK